MSDAKTIWKDPAKELPKANRYVACLYCHWKGSFPASYEVMFGRVWKGNNGGLMAQTEDESGKGCWGVVIGPSESHYDEVAVAWCYANEFIWPGWVKQ